MQGAAWKTGSFKGMIGLLFFSKLCNRNNLHQD